MSWRTARRLLHARIRHGEFEGDHEAIGPHHIQQVQKLLIRSDQPAKLVLVKSGASYSRSGRPAPCDFRYQLSLSALLNVFVMGSVRYAMNVRSPVVIKTSTGWPGPTFCGSKPGSGSEEIFSRAK
jgi:hypothetical protein